MSTVQKYHSEYFKYCVAMFKTNIPHFFDYTEQQLFETYLLKKDIQYYVLFNEDRRIVAAGGYGYNNILKTVDLTWGMVDRSCHKNGFGRRLTDYRIQKITTEHPKSNILLNTTQHTFRFYEKFGFKITKITKNYYALGLDRYYMIKIV